MIHNVLFAAFALEVVIYWSDAGIILLSSKFSNRSGSFVDFDVKGTHLVVKYLPCFGNLDGISIVLEVFQLHKVDARYRTIVGTFRYTQVHFDVLRGSPSLLRCKICLNVLP